MCVCVVVFFFFFFFTFLLFYIVVLPLVIYLSVYAPPPRNLCVPSFKALLLSVAPACLLLLYKYLFVVFVFASLPVGNK